MNDSAAASPETSRRRLLAWLGAGGVAALATLFSRDEAKAGHDGTNTLHLGEFNEAPPGTSTGVEATAEIFALRVHNESTGPDAGGILASSRGEQAAIKGNAFDPSPTGVAGISLTSTEELGAHTGVFGLSGSGVGVVGQSASGPGVRGESGTGHGVVGTSEDGDGLTGHSEVGAGVRAHGNSGPGAVFTSDSGDPGVPAMRAIRPTGVAVAAESESGSGVRGISDSGIGVEALSPGGIALRVEGRIAFSTVGSGVVPAGADSAFVAEPAVTTESHVTVTLVGDPGRRQLAWVERSPESGFIVHLTRGAPRDTAVPLTYAIMEPA